MLTVYFDGACEWHVWADGSKHRNPGGIATYGWLISKSGSQLAYGYGEVGRGGTISNNIAEYKALIKSLEAIRDLGLNGNDLTILGDSQLIVNQVNGHWAINKDHLRQLKQHACNLLDSFNSQKTISWIPREQNQAADDLSKKAYQEAKRRDGQPWDKRFRVVTSQALRVPGGGQALRVPGGGQEPETERC